MKTYTYSRWNLPEARWGSRLSRYVLLACVLIRFLDDRVVVTKGWIRKMTYRSSDLRSFTVIPSGVGAECVLVEIGDDRVAISAELTRGYLSLVDRLQEITQHSSGRSHDVQPGTGTDPLEGAQP